MKKRKKSIVVINNNSFLPKGDNIFYLCLKCMTVINSNPIEYSACKCENITIDVDGGRAGAKDTEKMVILEID